MEIEVLEKRRHCDFCDNKEHSYYKCLGCGKDACYECKKTQGVEYPHALYFGGSDDGWYCTICNATSQDELLVGYKAIKSMRDELSQFNAAFKVRSDQAEKTLKRLRDSRKKRN